ncbi:DUF808 domain-containing protein [Vibrio sp. S9_S30]|uniref:DUF808 domain-containing protein n=1 Tax=Vibrio sp. S9_S30 TaxID=2720226 RepID=UPI001680C84D|nr:DUF808 domain-containing protein [Vibrio sp. S9_S30]MBD1557494.1 DUF808 domain-containing protein [Vibrio sp. S9_S30]
MAGLSLLTLLDDIATVLDDVAVMSKVAAKKTAGVLGDDLALNAQQVSGVRAEREIPVVWSVAKGSFKNKLILVPSALLISSVAPWLITPLLLIGGLFLCFEGAEKVLEKMFHASEEEDEPASVSEHVENIGEYEKKKITGAIRTDFILSAEIVVIALGTVQNQPLTTQVLVLSVIALLMTIGVYGLVAGIVKLDDLGFYLQEKGQGTGFIAVIGDGFVAFAPKLMHMLTVIGTMAMFLVGGGIVVHGVPMIYHLIEAMISSIPSIPFINDFWPILFNGLAGFIAGLMVVFTMTIVRRVRS